MIISILNNKHGYSLFFFSGEQSSSKTADSPVDDIGYSFFNLKTVRGVVADKPYKRPSKVDSNHERTPSDDIGFSFLPVKEKGKKYKHKRAVETKELTLNAVVEQTVRKQKTDISKPAIIDHYQHQKRGQKTQIEVQERVDKNNDCFENQNKSEYKESKKVSPTISYASVVVNAVDEINTNQIEESKSESDINVNQSNFNRLSRSSADSNSSSIEVLNQNNLETENFEQSSNFEFVESKFNACVIHLFHLEKKFDDSL